MEWYKNPVVWLVPVSIIILIIIVCAIRFTKTSSVTTSDPPDKFVEKEEPVDNGQSLLLPDDSENPEIYDAALPAWLSNHPSTSSFNRYTRGRKNFVHGLNSVNTQVQLPETEYIPYDDTVRFQTPTVQLPKENPTVGRYIRATENIDQRQYSDADSDVDDGVTPV